MTRQCAWCGNFDGQSYWKVVDGVLGGKDGRARGVCRLRDFHAVVVDGQGGRTEMDVSFCSKKEADLWAKSLGKGEVKWVNLP